MSDPLKGGRKIIGGVFSTRQAPLGPATYFLGERLEYDNINKYHIPNVGGDLSGIYNGTSDEAGRTLAGAGVDDVIVHGEIAESGLVDAAGVPLAVALTEDEIYAYQILGFLVKEY